MTDNTIMNGADRHLKDLEVKLDSVAAHFQRAESDLDPRRIQNALEELQEVRLKLRELIGKVLDLRTLAQPANWRLRMQFDTVMYSEFLHLSEETLLVLALRECGGPVMDKFQAALDRARQDE